MKFTLLTDEEFTSFVNSRPEKNFFQTVMMKNRFINNNIETYLVGVKKNNKVIAASLIANTNHDFYGKKSFEAYMGYIMDYNDSALLKFITKNTKQFLKEKNAFRLVIDPYITNVSRDMEANIIVGIDNRHVTKQLKQLGYKINKYSEQIKWCYCLELENKTEEEILKEMRASTRYSINKTLNKFKLEIRDLKKEELKDFKKITSSTCNRKSFSDKTLKYYEDMYDYFKDNIVYKIISLNCDKYIDTLQEDINTLEKRLKTLPDIDARKKQKEQLKLDIESNKKNISKIKTLKKEKGNIIDLSAAMFITYGDEIIYLFSGSLDEYFEFWGQYGIQWDIIKYAIKNGYKRYNMYGIKDVFNPKGKDYGIYNFKKGFGGHVEELLGSFILPITSLNILYAPLKKLKFIVKKITKKN